MKRIRARGQQLQPTPPARLIYFGLVCEAKAGSHVHVGLLPIRPHPLCLMSVVLPPMLLEFNFQVLFMKGQRRARCSAVYVTNLNHPGPISVRLSPSTAVHTILVVLLLESRQFVHTITVPMPSIDRRLCRCSDLPVLNCPLHGCFWCILFACACCHQLVGLVALADRDER